MHSKLAGQDYCSRERNRWIVRNAKLFVVLSNDHWPVHNARAACTTWKSERSNGFNAWSDRFASQFSHILSVSDRHGHFAVCDRLMSFIESFLGEREKERERSTGEGANKISRSCLNVVSDKSCSYLWLKFIKLPTNSNEDRPLITTWERN